MARDKIKTILLTSLVVASFGWTIYHLLTYDNYYYGEPLKYLKVVLKDKPEFYFDGNTKISFYRFYTNEYQNQFRIEEGGNDYIRGNRTLIRRLESLNSWDTVTVGIRSSQIEKLLNKSTRIGVIGLAINETLLIDPLIVKKIDKENKEERYFFYYLYLLMLITISVIGYIKSKTKK